MLRKQYEITQEREVCVLDSLSQFGSQDAKENKSSWLEIWEVYCDFAVTLKVNCPDSFNLLLKQSAWFKYKMSWKFIHAKQDIDDNSCLTLVLGGTTIGSWHQADITILLKVAPIPTLSNLWDTLSLDRRRTTGDTRWRFSFSLFSLVWFVPPKKRKLSKVSQRYQGSSALGGGLGCVCVCTLSGFVMLIHRQVVSLQLNFVPVSGSRPLLFGVCFISTVYWLSCIFPALITEKEDQPKSCWSEHLASELKLFQKCLRSFFHSDFDFYFIL